MYFWNIKQTILYINNNQLNNKERIYYYIGTIIICSINWILSGACLSYHTLIAYKFHNKIPHQHELMNFYTHYGFICSAITVVIIIIGLYICYYISNKQHTTQKKIDKIICINFIISLHILVYTLILIAIFIWYVSYFIESSIETFKNSLSNQQVNNMATKSHTITTIFKALQSLIQIPLIPMKIKKFTLAMRSTMLSWYLFIAPIPLIMTIIQYYLMIRSMKNTKTKTTDTIIFS